MTKELKNMLSKYSKMKLYDLRSEVVKRNLIDKKKASDLEKKDLVEMLKNWSKRPSDLPKLKNKVDKKRTRRRRSRSEDGGNFTNKDILDQLGEFEEDLFEELDDIRNDIILARDMIRSIRLKDLQKHKTGGKHFTNWEWKDSNDEVEDFKNFYDPKERKSFFRQRSQKPRPCVTC